MDDASGYHVQDQIRNPSRSTLHFQMAKLWTGVSWRTILRSNEAYPYACHVQTVIWGTGLDERRGRSEFSKLVFLLLAFYRNRELINKFSPCFFFLWSPNVFTSETVTCRLLAGLFEMSVGHSSLNFKSHLKCFFFFKLMQRNEILKVTLSLLEKSQSHISNIWNVIQVCPFSTDVNFNGWRPNLYVLVQY